MVDLFLEARSSPRDLPGPRQHRRPAARRPGGAFLPRALRLLLAAVRRLRQPCAALVVAATLTVRRGRNWRASSNGFASVGQEPGFAATAGRDGTWCDDNDVDDLFGLSRNARLTERVGRQLRRSRSRCVSTGEARFCDFRYRTRGSWSRARRAVAKAERRFRGARFVVTSLSRKRAGARILYKKLYCACGENGIKEQQLVR